MELKFESSTLEKYIASYVIKDKSFFLKVAKYLRTNDYKKKSYFIDNKLQWFINAAVDYYDKYEKIPTFEMFNAVIEKKFTDDALLQKALKNTCEFIYNAQLDDFDPDYIKDETVNFIKTQRAVEATLQNELDIQNGKFDGLSDRMQEAININLDKDFGLSLADVDSALDLIHEAEEDTGLTFGTNGLDNILGNPRGSELYVIGGTSGIGKTIHLGNIAVENMKKGKKGVFFTGEVSKKKLAGRMYRSLLNKSGMELLDSTTKEEAKDIILGYKGDIRIKEFDANCACCNDFEAYLNDLAAVEGYIPDFICIDYILITNTNRRSDDANSYAKFKLVSEEMRNLAKKYDIPVFSAVQINRSGFSEKGPGTKALISLKDIADSKGIIDTAEVMILINQTDAEKAKGEKDGIAEQRLFIAKNRNGTTGSVLTITIDYNTMSIRDGKKL